jgi:hypothetical protein
LTSPVRKRKTAEQFTGAGADREAAARIDGFDDLFKATQEPASVRNVYGFRNLFEPLVFGMSMLERLSPDGRVRSRFFCGGSGAKVRYFKQWLNTVEGSHFAVTFVEPLGHLVAWIANEKAVLPSPTDLAKDWFGVRAPFANQIRVAAAIWHGFLLGYNSWGLWDYVGKTSGARTDLLALETWCQGLAKRYPAITQFHAQLRASFYQPVGGNVRDAHFQFDADAHEGFIARIMHSLSNLLSALTAQAIDQTLPDATVARFDDWVLCQGKSNDKLAGAIDEQLVTAFPGNSFKFRIEGA